MKELYSLLNNKGYICSKHFSAQVSASLNNYPVAGAFLNGSIGTGKSFLSETLAQILHTKCYFYQCFPGTREDDLLVKMLPNENSISGIALYNGVIIQAVNATLNQASDRKVVLALDEWDKTRPSADSFLLDFLQTGRIKFANYDLQADLSKLIILLTLNMEREISEPLLRRLPVIQFYQLAPSLVYKALKQTHSYHPYLYSAVVLYERSLQAELSKPITIQELRQFLDAITKLGQDADWDSLVFQFVTKTEENHELLRKAEETTIKSEISTRPKLNVQAYSPDETTITEEMLADEKSAMPSLRQIRRFDSSIEPTEQKPVLSNAGGVLKFTEQAYDSLVRLVEEPAESPDRLGDLAQVHDKYITLKQPVRLSQIKDIEALWGQTGEILILEPFATLQDVRALQHWSSLHIIKFSKNEIMARDEGLDLRWTSDAGAEIIVDLKRKKNFQECFGTKWGAADEEKWIGSKGLIYRKYQKENKFKVYEYSRAKK